LQHKKTDIFHPDIFHVSLGNSNSCVQDALTRELQIKKQTKIYVTLSVDFSTAAPITNISFEKVSIRLN